MENACVVGYNILKMYSLAQAEFTQGVSYLRETELALRETIPLSLQ